MHVVCGRVPLDQDVTAPFYFSILFLTQKNNIFFDSKGNDFQIMKLLPQNMTSRFDWSFECFSQ